MRDLGFQTVSQKGLVGVNDQVEDHTWCELSLNGNQYLVDLSVDAHQFHTDYSQFLKHYEFKEIDTERQKSSWKAARPYYSSLEEFLYTIPQY